MFGLPLNDDEQAPTPPTALPRAEWKMPILLCAGELPSWSEPSMTRRLIVFPFDKVVEHGDTEVPKFLEPNLMKFLEAINVTYKKCFGCTDDLSAVRISYTEMRVAASILSAFNVKLLDSYMSYNHGEAIVDMATVLRNGNKAQKIVRQPYRRRRKKTALKLELIGTQGLLERKERQLRELRELHEEAMELKEKNYKRALGLLESKEREMRELYEEDMKLKQEYYKKQMQAEEFCMKLMDDLSLAQRKLEAADEKTTCQICYTREKAWARTACGHMFCRTCLNEISGKPCAFCRADDNGCVHVRM